MIKNMSNFNKGLIVAVGCFLVSLVFVWRSVPYFADKYASHVKYSRPVNINAADGSTIVDVSVDRNLKNGGYASELGPDHPYTKAKLALEGLELTDEQFKVLVSRILSKYETGERAAKEQVERELEVLKSHQNQYNNYNLSAEDISGKVNKESKVYFKGNNL